MEELVALGDLESVAFGKVGNTVRIGKFWKIVRFGGIGRIGGTYQENW